MKHLIFDCGGVMVYPRTGDWAMPLGAARVLGSRAATLHSSRYLLAHREAVRWLAEDRLVPDVAEERRLRGKYLRAMDRSMDWHLTEAELKALTDDFTDNIDRYGFFDDVVPWLTRWRGRYTLSLLSDAMPSILGFLQRKGILQLLDEAVISTQVAATKPSPVMYAAILKKLDADPADCLFVDDRVDNLVGAQEQGMRAVQMARSEFLPAALWDGPVVDGFEALDRLLEHP